MIFPEGKKGETGQLLKARKPGLLPASSLILLLLLLPSFKPRDFVLPERNLNLTRRGKNPLCSRSNACVHACVRTHKHGRVAILSRASIYMHVCTMYLPC